MSYFSSIESASSAAEGFPPPPPQALPSPSLLSSAFSLVPFSPTKLRPLPKLNINSKDTNGNSRSSSSEAESSGHYESNNNSNHARENSSDNNSVLVSVGNDSFGKMHDLFNESNRSKNSSSSSSSSDSDTGGRGRGKNDVSAPASLSRAHSTTTTTTTETTTINSSPLRFLHHPISAEESAAAVAMVQSFYFSSSSSTASDQTMLEGESGSNSPKLPNSVADLVADGSTALETNIRMMNGDIAGRGGGSETGYSSDLDDNDDLDEEDDPSDDANTAHHNNHHHPCHNPSSKISRGNDSSRRKMINSNENTNVQHGTKTGKSSSNSGSSARNKNRREERNAREKERSFRISNQINELRDLLSSGGVVLSKDTKSSVLSEAANYIRQLQLHQLQCEIEQKQLIQQMSIFDGLMLSPSAPGIGTSLPVQSGPGCDLSMGDYRTIFAEAGVAMAVAAMGGTFIDCNDLFVRLSGYSKQELCALTIFNLTSRNDLQIAFNLISQMIANPYGDGGTTVAALPHMVWLRGTLKNRQDLGLSVSFITGSEQQHNSNLHNSNCGVPQYLCVTLVQNPAVSSASFSSCSSFAHTPTPPTPVSFESVMSTSPINSASSALMASSASKKFIIASNPALTSG